MANNKDLFGFLGGDIKTKLFSIAIIALIIIVLVWQGRNILNWIKMKQIEKQLNREIKNEALLGNGLSFSESQYKVFADTLYGAMKGLGTDTNAVYGVFNAMNTKADILKLVSAFGSRDGESLSQWMAGEWKLSISNINKILASKGIDYQF